MLTSGLEHIESVYNRNANGPPSNEAPKSPLRRYLKEDNDGNNCNCGTDRRNAGRERGKQP